MDFKKILDERFEEVLLVMTMVVMVFLVFTQSLSRYILGNSFGWSSELARYLLIWQVWIGASFGIKKGRHISITFVVDRLKGKIKFIIMALALSIWFLFAAFLAWEGTKYLNVVIDQKSPSLQVSMAFVYVVIPLSGVLMCLRLIQNIMLLYKQYFK